jgi:hypothetical protein
LTTESRPAKRFHTKATTLLDSTNKLFALWQAHDVASYQPRKPIFMVPCDRDETFVGCKNILDNIDHKNMLPGVLRGLN